MDSLFPKEIWIEFSQYLSHRDLRSLRIACGPLNQLITSSDFSWQPLLNRLHVIDNTIKTSAEPGQIRQAFTEGYQKVKARQKAEIEYFRLNHLDLANKFFILKEDLNEQVRLSTLEVISEELDNINIAIIKPIIEGQIRNNSVDLLILDQGISRIPSQLFREQEYATFWQGLLNLNCSFNFLQSLPNELSQCPLLRILFCHDNKLLFLPDSIGSLPALEWLALDRNEIQELPAAIGNLPALEILSLEDNLLKGIPESIQVKFGQEWCQKVLKKQKFPTMRIELGDPALGSLS